jgi:hypothetical protein
LKEVCDASPPLLPACLIVSLVLLLLPAHAPRGSGPANFDPAQLHGRRTDRQPFFPLSVGTTFRWEATVTDPEDNSTSQQVEQDFVTSQTKDARRRAGARRAQHGATSMASRKRTRSILRAGQVRQRLVPRRGHQELRAR